ncbi:MAG: hypothetical protein JNK40_11080 [Chromatiales bacterium]|nr:hypothetical protein [Chromatiales bacterium]
MKHSLAVIVIALALVPAAPRAASPGPAEVVQAFNRALTARKLEDATALLAKGSVQYTLRAAHPGVTTGDAGITSDLKTHWQTIGPVLFSVTSAYKRVPKILDTRVDGDLATVWTQVASETVERSGKSRKDNFSEVYLMVKVGDAWQIGAIADNRGTDNLSVGPAAAPAPAGKPR